MNIQTVITSCMQKVASPTDDFNSMRSQLNSGMPHAQHRVVPVRRRQPVRNKVQPAQKPAQQQNYTTNFTQDPVTGGYRRQPAAQAPTQPAPTAPAGNPDDEWI